MRRTILLAALLWASVTTVEASTTAIRATPANAVPGQSVTFTAAFTSSCPGSLTTHYFTIDGKVYSGALAQKGQAGTETLSISTLRAGAHTVAYNWKINGTICRGVASISYTVVAPPSPSPSPSPSPTPSPSPSPSLPSPVTLVASRPAGTPLVGYLGGALIVLTIAAGAALALSSRR